MERNANTETNQTSTTLSWPDESSVGVENPPPKTRKVKDEAQDANEHVAKVDAPGTNKS